MTALIVLAAFTALFAWGACKASSDNEKADNEVKNNQKIRDTNGKGNV